MRPEAISAGDPKGVKAGTTLDHLFLTGQVPIAIARPQQFANSAMSWVSQPPVAWFRAVSPCVVCALLAKAYGALRLR